MTFATSTFLEVIFAMMILTPIVLLWIAALVDAISNHDSAVGLVASLLLILIIPILGPLLYFIFRKPKVDPEKVHAGQAAIEAERAARPAGTGLYR